MDKSLFYNSQLETDVKEAIDLIIKWEKRGKYN